MKKILNSWKSAKCWLIEKVGANNILIFAIAILLYMLFYNLTGDRFGGAFITLFLTMFKKILDYIFLYDYVSLDDVEFSDLGAVVAGILIAYLIMLI